MSLQLHLYASPFHILLWSVKHQGNTLRVSSYVRSVSICDHWVGLQSVLFNMLNLLWSLGLTEQHLKEISNVCQVSKGFRMKDLLCTQICAPEPSSGVPNSGTLHYSDSHIVTEPMGVIKRTLFMLDHSTSKSWASWLPCRICDASAGHWRWLRSVWDTQNSLWRLQRNEIQNNDDAKARLRGTAHIDAAGARVCKVLWLCVW